MLGPVYRRSTGACLIAEGQPVHPQLDKAIGPKRRFAGLWRNPIGFALGLSRE
jgi:hypothetical protein